MARELKGLALIAAGFIFFSGCSFKEFYRDFSEKQITSSVQTPKKKEYPLEGGKILLGIEGEEAWKNFKNALDLYAVSLNKVRLSSNEIYQFIYPSDKPPRDILTLKECKELRARARRLYDDAILKKPKSKSKKDGIGDVEPGLPKQN